MRHGTRVLLLVAAWLCGMLWASAPVALGQAPTPELPTSELWSAAENLSKTATEAVNPRIVADASGVVHLFWGERDTDQTGDVTNRIYYTRLEGRTWLQPRDILVSPEGPASLTRYLAAAIGPDGRIHVAWAGGYGSHIYYSSAWASEAWNAAKWAVPKKLNDDVAGATRPEIVADARGIVHVVYSGAVGDDLSYVRSVDGGVHWTKPAPVIAGPIEVERLLFWAKLAPAESGTLHLVWQWGTIDGNYENMGVAYSRLSEGGLTWEEPRIVAEGPYGLPAVAATEGTVLLVWAGTTDHRFRFWQVSSDDGLTWTEPAHTEEMGGYIGGSTLVVDSAETIHAGMAVTLYKHQRDAVVHMEWNGAGWSEPEVLQWDPALFHDLGSVQMAISEGNILHAAFEVPFDLQGKEKGSHNVYYARRQLSSPYVAPQPLPTGQPSGIGIGRPSAPAEERPPAASAGAPAAGVPPLNGSRPHASRLPAMAVGVASAVFALAAASIVREVRRGRR